MALGHHVQITLVLVGGLFLDPIDDTPCVTRKRCCGRWLLIDMVIHRIGGPIPAVGRRVHVLQDRAGLGSPLRLRHVHPLEDRAGLGAPGLRRRIHALRRRAALRLRSIRRRNALPVHAGPLRRDRNLPVCRRIGLPKICSSYLDRMLRRLDVLFGCLVVVEQGREIQGDAIGRQSRKPAMPAAKGPGFRVVEGHGHMRCAVEDLADELGEHPAGPDLDETGDPVARHRFDHLAEPHWLPYLIAELISDLLAVLLCRGVRVDGELRLSEFDRLQVFGQRLRAGCHDR